MALQWNIRGKAENSLRGRDRDCNTATYNRGGTGRGESAGPFHSSFSVTQALNNCAAEELKLVSSA